MISKNRGAQQSLIWTLAITKLLREILDDTAKRLQGHLDDQPLVRAELEGVLGDTYRDLGEYQAAEPHAQTALALRRAAGGARPELSALAGAPGEPCATIARVTGTSDRRWKIRSAES